MFNVLAKDDTHAVDISQAELANAIGLIRWFRRKVGSTIDKSLRSRRLRLSPTGIDGHLEG